MVVKPKKTNAPTHGWNYDKMKELFKFNDEDIY